MLLTFSLPDDQNYTTKSRCTYCRKKNHLAENRFKKLEDERKSKTKAEELSLSCYGCGKPEYYRFYCPDCSKTHLNSPKKLDFNTMQTTSCNFSNGLY